VVPTPGEHQAPPIPGAGSHGALQAKPARKALAGFFLAGLLMSFLGPILPAWGYHLRSDFSSAGLHFLGMALGILAAASVAHRLIPAKGVAFVLALASGVAAGALLYLAVVSPPVSSWWRLAGVFLLGGSSGLLASALFHGISTIYHHDPAATVNLAGLLFGLGSLVNALLVSGTFYVYTVPSILVLLAIIPGFYAISYARSSFPIEAQRPEPSWRQALEDFRSPGAVLFALLLFFQFGNEWSVAGWLAIFLIQRIGISPASGLFLLALYWFSLIVGRIVAQFLLPRVRHGKLLTISAMAALFGCVILSFTTNVFGAVSGILFVGGGFALVYPLVVEKIGHRFPYFHPGLFNGIFSFAMAGGLLAPWTVGFFADMWGIGILMVQPLLGTFMVFGLLLLIRLEAMLTGAEPAT
jgi:FHS family glucose/mannose:H+ symporter-like MFS transporter